MTLPSTVFTKIKTDVSVRLATSLSFNKINSHLYTLIILSLNALLTRNLISLRVKTVLSTSTTIHHRFFALLFIYKFKLDFKINYKLQINLKQDKVTVAHEIDSNRSIYVVIEDRRDLGR
jgi:hypothetical protein